MGKRIGGWGDWLMDGRVDSYEEMIYAAYDEGIFFATVIRVVMLMMLVRRVLMSRLPFTCRLGDLGM